VATAWAHTPGTPPADLTAGRPEILLPLLVLASLYALGWFRLSRRARPSRAARRPAFTLVGFTALVVALLSPLDQLADRLFAAHMVQHMLLIMVAAPALLLADPFPIVVWALPRAWRLRIGHSITRGSAAGRVWRAATAMAPAWIVSACLLWSWHLPSAYDAALAHRRLHDLEHLSFFLGAVLFWWPVIHPAPHYGRGASYPARVVYLVLGAFQTAALGLLITLAPTVLYRSYAGELAALEDQTWGGVVMWGVGGAIDMLAVLIVLYAALGSASSSPTPPAAEGAGRRSENRRTADERVFAAAPRPFRR
jgi:putative membrane protein